MKELKDQVAEVIRGYERLLKKMRNIEFIIDGEISFGYTLSRPEIQLYKGAGKVAELLDLEATEKESGIENYPTEVSVKVGNIRVYEVN